MLSRRKQEDPGSAYLRQASHGDAQHCCSTELIAKELIANKRGMRADIRSSQSLVEDSNG